jgi:hypothetical protein
VTGDREVEAMGAMVAAFESLDSDARSRVFRWFTERYDSVANTPAPPVEQRAGEAEAAGASRPEVPATLEQLYAMIGPDAQWQRVLVAAYWLQEVIGHPDFDAFAVNYALRQCGHAIGNLSRELVKLTSGKMLAAQLSPEGARKRYHVSSDGMRWVKRRLFEPKA